MQADSVNAGRRANEPVVLGGPSRALEQDCEDETVPASDDEHQNKMLSFKGPDNRKDEQHFRND